MQLSKLLITSIFIGKIDASYTKALIMDVCFDKAEKKWSPLIGRFIVDFVMIDDSIQHIIGKHIHRLNKAEVNNQGKFKIRIKSIKKIMKLYLTDSISIKKFNKTTKNILDLYVIRNLLAHNSLSFAYELQKNGKLKAVGFQINGKKEDVSINFKELKTKIDQLRSERIRFTELSMSYYEAELKLIEQKESALFSRC